MRWMWIDRVVELDTGVRLVAIKNVSLAEEHLHDHFEAAPDAGLAALPIMPASLIIEGMAQSAGILVGHAGAFREKVILAKIRKAELDREVVPGQTIRYTATIERLDGIGASTQGIVELLDHTSQSAPVEIGRIDLMFSYLDQNMVGRDFPEHNFVFGEWFKTLLRTSGVDVPSA